MDFRNALKNVVNTFTNLGVKKNTNAFKGGNDFLRYGSRNRGTLVSNWSDIDIENEDLYRGYSFAVIQKRANKVSSLAKVNLKTWAKPEVVDAYQEKDETVLHPYLSLIEDSTKFSEKQFWKTISIYLDLAGRYYLGVVRQQMGISDNVSPVKEFIMLNPYEIRRVVNSDGVLAGYVEQKKDGRYREWAPFQIIEMRELNPFDPENSQWAMVDAAKEAVFTINEGGNYTRQTLHNNLNAPGIITTDVILSDEMFANFQARVRDHSQGEPIFGNGAGSIKWEAMSVDLDKAALMDVNNMSREELFAVSGTSKTTLGIEQSGTTRETARVQNENFASDTVQPRLEDIVDFLNLDYKKYYKDDYEKTGFYIEVESAVSRDYGVESEATTMRQAQFELAATLIKAKYTTTSAYQYATGEIGLEDLELEDGYETPQLDEGDMGDNGGDGEIAPTNPIMPTESEIIEDNKLGLDVFNDEVELVKGDVENIVTVADNDLSEEKVIETTEHNCPDCAGRGIDDFVELLGSDGETLRNAYETLLGEVVGIEKDAVNNAIKRVKINSFTEDDIITEKERKKLLERLINAFKRYWWFIVPLFGKNTMKNRNSEFKTNYNFVFNNTLQKKLEEQVSSVADGHLNTILHDILDATNNASTAIVEEAAAGLIITAYRQDPERFRHYFDTEPTIKQAKEAIQNTDILEKNRKIYDKAYKLAQDGYSRQDIIKAIEKEYEHISTARANTIAGNETARAFSQSQYEADYQFLNETGNITTAYKELYSRTGDPCIYCQKLIEKGPIPFTENFLNKGEAITVNENGKVKTFTANYEAISSGTVHVNCHCAYRLILKPKTDNSVKKNGNGGGNPNHDPKTGKFTTGGGTSLKDRAKGVKGSTYKSYSSDGKNIVSEWIETSHPVYTDTKIIMSQDQIGMAKEDAAELGIAKMAYEVRDKRLVNPFTLFEPLASREEKFVRDYMKKQFKVDDKELDKLLGASK